MAKRTRALASIRYTFDERNRLHIEDPADRLRPRRILEGRLSADEQNRLLYTVESSQGAQTPEIVELDGVWALTSDHELSLTLHETDARSRQTLFLKGAVTRARADRLVFALRQSGSDENVSAQEFALSGRWQADANNRLTFLAGKADGSEDRLTLQGGWEVGARHEVLYRYRQRAQGARARDEHTLVFDGAWDFAQANRLVYRVEGSADSAFDFQASVQSPSLLARDGRLVYQVGIGMAGGRTRRRRVTFFGSWKLNRDLSVSFDIPYADGRVQTIRFEGAYAITAKDRLAVALQNSRREGLGVTVTFTKDVVPDAGLFLQLRKDAKESAAIGGVRVRF